MWAAVPSVKEANRRAKESAVAAARAQLGQRFTLKELEAHPSWRLGIGERKRLWRTQHEDASAADAMKSHTSKLVSAHTGETRQREVDCSQLGGVALLRALPRQRLRLQSSLLREEVRECRRIPLGRRQSLPPTPLQRR
jgi:hypothetical protein